MQINGPCCLLIRKDTSKLWWKDFGESSVMLYDYNYRFIICTSVIVYHNKGVAKQVRRVQTNFGLFGGDINYFALKGSCCQNILIIVSCCIWHWLSRPHIEAGLPLRGGIIHLLYSVLSEHGLIAHYSPCYPSKPAVWAG